MMYHFMFGLRGGSLVAVTPSAPAGCSPPAAASFFSSSCMIKLSSSLRFDLVVPEIAVQKSDAPLNHVIDDEEIHSENEYRNHNHRGSGAHLFKRWRGDLTHLAAHVVVKRFDPLRPRLKPVSEIVARSRDRVCHLLLRLHCHTAPDRSQLPSKILAGAEGFEPPSSVLETDSLTVELTPLKSVVGGQRLVVSFSG